MVHRLVADAFIPNKLLKPQINHKNGVRDDNRLENLEWVTASENVRHAYDTGITKPAKGERHPHSKLDDIKVMTIVTSLKNGQSGASLARLYGVNQSIVSDINRFKSWKHIPRL